MTTPIDWGHPGFILVNLSEAKPGGGVIDPTGVVDSAAGIATAATALANGGTGQIGVLPAGTYLLNSTPTIAAGARFMLAQGVQFTGTGSPTAIYAASLAMIFQAPLAAGGQSGGQNVFVGGAGNTSLTNGAGAITLATGNVGVGVTAMLNLTTGFQNAALGQDALYTCSTGYYNVAIGSNALGFLTTGTDNVALGTQAGFNMTDPTGNTAVGHQALYSNVHGYQNTAIGDGALWNTLSGGNVAIGFYAGHYETGSYAFYVDAFDRTNTAGDKANALFYGTFNTTAAGQTLAINAATNISVSLSISGNDVKAIAANHVQGNTANAVGATTVLSPTISFTCLGSAKKVHVEVTAYPLNTHASPSGTTMTLLLDGSPVAGAPTPVGGAFYSGIVGIPWSTPLTLAWDVIFPDNAAHTLGVQVATDTNVQTITLTSGHIHAQELLA